MSDDADARPRRLPCPELPAEGGEVTLDEGASRHARVLRLAAGTEVILVDGRGNEAVARVHGVARGGLRCVAQRPTQLPVSTSPLTCVLGLPKGGKVEGVVRMLTELGVDALHLAQCERSVPRPVDHGARLERLRRVALEACLQSEQPRAPRLHALAPLLEVATQAPANARKLVFWERSSARLDAVLAHAPAGGSEAGTAALPIWAVVGPEGGLSAAEVVALEALEFAQVGLGPGILRVETAAVVVAGLLLDRLGRLHT